MFELTDYFIFVYNLFRFYFRLSDGISIDGSNKSSGSQSSTILAVELLRKLYNVDTKTREELILKVIKTPENNKYSIQVQLFFYSLHVVLKALGICLCSSSTGYTSILCDRLTWPFLYNNINIFWLQVHLFANICLINLKLIWCCPPNEGKLIYFVIYIYYKVWQIYLYFLQAKCFRRWLENVRSSALKGHGVSLENVNSTEHAQLIETANYGVCLQR